MAYKGRGAKVRVELIKNGTEVLVSANREGLRYLAEICTGLANDEYNHRTLPHVHYAPELNPVEHIWGHLKKHDIPNLCPRELWELIAAARAALRRMRRRPTLVTAFRKQADLF